MILTLCSAVEKTVKTNTKTVKKPSILHGIVANYTDTEFTMDENVKRVDVEI